MKQDVNWIPYDLVLPILALECHVAFVTIINGAESTVVKNYRRELIHELHVFCNWDVNYVFLLCASPGVNLCRSIKEINATQHMLLKKGQKAPVVYMK